MESRGLFTVGKDALLPQDGRAKGMWAPGALKPGDKVLIKVHRARNPEHNAVAHVVFDKIAKARGLPADVIKLWLKADTGYVDVIRLPTGKCVHSPKSLAFESMSQDEFQQWWKEALVVISEKILPELPQAEFDEICDIIAGKPE